MVCLFHAKFGVDHSRLPRTFGWQGILEVRSDGVILRLFSPRQLHSRGVFLALSAPVASGVSMLVIWEALISDLFRLVPADIWVGWWLGLSIVIFAAAVVSFIMGLFGFLYFFDFLFTRLQFRSTREVAILSLRDLSLGRLHHVIRTSIAREIVPTSIHQQEVVMTVAATRGGVISALGPFLKRAPT